MNSDSGGRSWAPYAWMLSGCLAFAWMSEFAHRLGSSCDWRIVALARSLLAFLFAFSLAKLQGARLVFGHSGILWLRSCAGSFSLLCTFFALTRLSPSEVLTLTNTFPIWVAILSWPLLHVRPSLAVWLAAGCGVMGIFLIKRPEMDLAMGAQLAMPLALIAAFTSALALLGLHRLKNIHPWAIVVHFSGVATAFVLFAWITGAVFLDDPVPLEPLANGHNLLLLLGVGATATVGQMCLTRAYTEGEPARVAVVGLAQVVMAVGMDFVFQHSVFDAAKLAGIGLVLAPTAWVMAAKAGE